MKGWKFILICAAIGVMLFLLLCRRQEEKEPPKPKAEPKRTELLPGEVNDPQWPVPIIAWVRDSTCTDSVKCPPKGENCAQKTFTVQKDTTYYLTVSYFNGDTINASCRTCGTVYEDTTVLGNRETACPTGGPSVTSMRLVPGKTYKLETCLHACPDKPGCKCGEHVQSDAVVSMRRLF